jgi:hypothetical protein
MKKNIIVLLLLATTSNTFCLSNPYEDPRTLRDLQEDKRKNEKTPAKTESNKPDSNTVLDPNNKASGEWYYIGYTGTVFNAGTGTIIDPSIPFRFATLTGILLILPETRKFGVGIGTAVAVGVTLDWLTVKGYFDTWQNSKTK